MKIYFTCFSDVKFLHFRKKLCRKARAVFDGVFEYDYDEFLTKTDFYQDNIKILTEERGCGYWLWKPYIILNALEQIDQGDVVFYMDCGDGFRKEIVDFLRDHFTNNDTLLLDSVFTNKHWTKYDCFYLMDSDGEEYRDAMQVTASVCGFKKNSAVIRLVEEWLHYCQDENVITDVPNLYGENDPSFLEHRHDQSILTNLKVKHNLPVCSISHGREALIKCNANKIYNNDKIRQLGYSHNILFGGL